MYSRSLPHRHAPFFRFFSEGRGRLYTGYLERIIHLQTVRQNWRIKSGGLFIQNKNHYISETHYLSDANYQTDNPSHTNGLSTDVCGEATVSGVKTAISVVNEFAPQPWVERSLVCFCFFTKIIYILTVDISMCKIILELEYCIKYDLLNVKIFQKNSLFHPEIILRPLFCFKVRKNTGLLIFSSLKQKK